MKRGRPKTSTKVQWKRWVQPWQIPLLQAVLDQAKTLPAAPLASLPISPSPDTIQGGANAPGAIPGPPVVTPPPHDPDEDQFA